MKKTALLFLDVLIGIIISIILGFASIWICNTIHIELFFIEIAFILLFAIGSFYVLKHISTPKWLTGICTFVPSIVLCSILSEHYSVLAYKANYTEKGEILNDIYYSLSGAVIISIYAAIVFAFFSAFSYLLKTRKE